MGEILSFTLYMYCLLKMFNKKPSSHLWWTGMLCFLIISTEVSFILKTFGGRTEHMRDSGASIGYSFSDTKVPEIERMKPE